MIYFVKYVINYRINHDRNLFSVLSVVVLFQQTIAGLNYFPFLVLIPFLCPRSPACFNFISVRPPPRRHQAARPTRARWAKNNYNFNWYSVFPFFPSLAKNKCRPYQQWKIKSKYRPAGSFECCCCTTES